MFVKYPRTEHLQGSKKLDQDSHFSSHKNDEGIAFEFLSHQIVVEEKMDGIGLGFGFENGQLYIQHRGHIYPSAVLRLGNLPFYIQDFYHWLLDYETLYYTVLEERYVLFGEWLKYKHTIFYNALPCYFMEYDIYDRNNDFFLSTPEREKLLVNYRQDIFSVAVLQTGDSLRLEDIKSLLLNKQYSIGKNHNWKNQLDTLIKKGNFTPISIYQETLNDNLFEGFYIKTENQIAVTGRYKWIRKSFMDIVLKNDHWKNRKVITNTLL